MTAPTRWPDTTGQATPRDPDPETAVAWIIGRHPRVAALIDRIPGAVETITDQGTTEAYLDLHALASAINLHIPAYQVMSSGEKALLSSVAALGWTPVLFSAASWDRLDDDGQRFVRDWLTAARFR